MPYDEKRADRLRKKRAQRLLREYIVHWKKDKTQRPGCGNEEWTVFDCCRYHRQLFRKSAELRARAEQMRVDTEAGVFTGIWWVAFGKLYDLAIPAELL